jgi:hypothetical protein
MKNRFDLEDNIMRCWEIVDELEMISNQKELTVEQYSALVKSLQILYSLKFNELFKTFESCIENKEFE